MSDEPQLIPVANSGICPITGEYVQGKAVAVILVDAGDGNQTAFPVARSYVKARAKARMQANREAAKKST